ncbi:hypothetical protein ACFWSF_24775 [Streptomyces sp. NPDC058611]|uniref:hypothetical protein n=1 Tax=unclassified Streptomyces TaxID=2593676 RepID=UPI00365D359B
MTSQVRNPRGHRGNHPPGSRGHRNETCCLGLQKTHLEHVFSAVALNLIRLDAWWNGHPLDRTRVSHLARLDLSLAA